MVDLTASAHIEAMSAEKPTSGAAAPAAGPAAEPGYEEQSAAGTGDGAGATATSAAEVEGDLYALGFGVNKSIRYHTKRRAFFDAAHRVCMLVALLGGSAAFFSFFGDKKATGAIAGLAVAVAAVIDQAFAFPERAREHDKLAERFSEFAIELFAAHGAITSADIVALKAKRLRLEISEPTALAALNVICHNEEATARGFGSDQLYRVGWLQRICAQVCTFPWFSPRPVTDWMAAMRDVVHAETVKLASRRADEAG